MSVPDHNNYVQQHAKDIHKGLTPPNVVPPLSKPFPKRKDNDSVNIIIHNHMEVMYNEMHNS